MNALRKSVPTAAEYLSIERKATTKSEYVRGEVFAMAGASLIHNQIATNLIRELSNQLKERECDVLGSDMKVKIEEADCYFYPDVSGLCGEINHPDRHTDTYINPQFVIEILSDSTEAYDRGDKFHDYQSIPSLREYVLVSQRSCAVEIYRKDKDRWEYQVHRDLADVLILESVGCEIPLAEIYRKVVHPEAHRPAPPERGFGD